MTQIQALSALLLNADFTPVSVFPLSIISFDRAMKLVMKDRVTIVEKHGLELRSANFVYEPPSVLALKSYRKQPTKVPFTRLNLLVRDENRCQYCGKTFPSNELTFDHVVPKSKGGGSKWENACTACVTCNQKKADKSDMKPIRAPFEPTVWQMAKLKNVRHENLHASWVDYLYWSGVLEKDE